MVKKKYQDILMESACLVGRIPGVSMSGATATASVYVSAYRDYYESCQLLGVIATNIQLIDSTESTIVKYKNKEGYDIDELKYSVQLYSENVDKAFKELKDYIEERKKKNWC